MRSAGQFKPMARVLPFISPDVVGRDRSLTDGQKRLYERLVRYADQD
jgi:hypothetical protein